MNDIISDSEIRKQQALKRLGEPNPRCRICGEGDERCLEDHHIAGQAMHGETHPVCRNCHRKLSDVQRDHPAQIAACASLPEVVGHYLLGLADMLVLVAKTLVKFATQLIDMARPHATGGAQ